MALYHFSAKMLSRGSRNTVGAIAYRAGCKLYDERTGESFDYRSKSVEHVEFLLPKDAPQWILDVQKLMSEDRGKGVQALCEIVEAPEKRIDSQVWREFEFALHRELTKDQNMTLAREFVQDQICTRGMAAQLNFHFDVDKKTGEEKPHCHVTMTTRRLDENGMAPKKEEAWNKKELLLDLRVQWQEYSNFHLKLNGHDVRIDHRSNKDRGIELEPQPKLGKGVREQEKRLQTLEGTTAPITDKAQAFHDTQLRNLYRIMRCPEVVLDIVSKHNSTFMWADVQKILHRYVDELPLFQKLEAKLKNSNELMVLQPDGIEPNDKAIYTTRTLLKAEKSLVETADRLACSKSHGAKEHHIEAAIKRANEKLKKRGGRLSSDQKAAIHHLVDEGQIKCVVGIAGAGKTTALSVCHDIWKESGYKVYGLAPTGKASQNLEQNGIPSTTLHKFLLSFEEGRCQYNSNSVLVLDEAGMVDMERFEKLLEAVNRLRVKLVVVGDGGQLQPVEAGPAFRLVTQRLGKIELNTVLRQKEAWQREATVLFGKQETQAAIQKYMDKGHVHIVQEKLPSLKESLKNGDRESVVKLYEVSTRVSAMIYREMMKDCPCPHEGGKQTRNPSYALIKQHQDFRRYLAWKEIQKDSATHILQEGESYLPYLQARFLDPTKMAMLFVNKKADKASQAQQAKGLLKKCGLESLIGIQNPSPLKSRSSIDVRQEAKAALIQAWHKEFQGSPHNNSKSNSQSNSTSNSNSLILAFSNRDVNDLNYAARTLLKQSGHIESREFTYTIHKTLEDDFEKEYTIQEEKSFSKGDRIVFTQNDNGLGVKNGTMGTIIDINRQKVRVQVDEGDEISFAPKLNPYFDQGWAITIHKSQGTTVGLTYLLASYEMTRNLVYVAMTRHWENVQVFGSSLDFWRPEKLPEVLAKSGEKLSPGDYLNAASLHKLIQQDHQILNKIFERVSNELEAMGTVSKKAFWQVADRFLGNKQSQEKEIRIAPESIREEVRAEELLHNKDKQADQSPKALEETRQKNSQATPHVSGSGPNLGPNLPDSPSSSHKAKEAGQINGIKDIKEIEEKVEFLRNNEKAEESLSAKTKSAPQQAFLAQLKKTFIEAKVVEEALRQNMASFADDIFSSIGEPYNPGASSATQRRYGKKGHIAVNLKTGAWIDHKDSDKSGGPLHMLTKLKGLSFKEAVEYGAKWAGLSQASLSSRMSEKMALKRTSYSSQQDEAKELEAEQKVKISKAQALWDKGKPIQGTLAERYLREHRKIEGDLPKDLRYLPSFRDTHSKRSFPCLMAGARSERGEITAVQITFLNAHTGAKAVIPVAKRSFGMVKGSSVTLQANEASKTLFIAEGIETALSLKSAGVQGTIKASLGLSNIKRILPESPQTQIVICADHDAPDSPAAKSLEKSVISLQERGLAVTIIKPDQLGDDFNDVLKAQGPQGVRDILESSLPKDLVKVLQDENHVSPENPIKKNGSAIFEALTQQCVKKLYAYLGEEKMDLTPDLIKRVESQAEKAANFIFHGHTLKGTQPTEKETKHFLLRAKYELDRVPEIRDELTHGWQKAGKYKGEKDETIAHMIAERQASIEGRMYLQAKQKGLKPLAIIPDLSAKELKAHRAKTEPLAQELIKKHGLSESTAIYCAKDILRYQETHGEKPSDSQTATMVQISRELDKKGYDPAIGSYNIECLRRRDGDLQFREMSAQGKDLSGFRDFPHKEQSYAQTQTLRRSYEKANLTAIEDNSKSSEIELSM